MKIFPNQKVIIIGLILLRQNDLFCSSLKRTNPSSSTKVKVAKFVAVPRYGLGNSLSVALLCPRKVKGEEFLSHFRISITNRSAADYAFSGHPLMIRVLLYAEDGKVLNFIQNYGGEYNFGLTALRGLTIIRSGETLEMRGQTLSLSWSKVSTHKNFLARAVLCACPKNFFSRTLEEILRKDRIKVVSKDVQSPFRQLAVIGPIPKDFNY